MISQRALIFLLVSFFCNLSYPKGLSLKELVDYALSNSPVFLNSQNNLSLAQLQVDNAFSTFLPALDLETRQGVRESDPDAFSENTFSDLNISLSSTIYNNGTNFINYDRSKLQEDVREIELERDRSQLCLDLSREFFRYAQSMKILEVQKYQLSHLKKQYRSIESQYKQGIKTRIDFIRFKARLQRAQLTLQQAEVVIAKSLEDIKRIINWKGEMLEVSFSRYLNINLPLSKRTPPLDAHFDFRIAEIQKKINQFDVTLEKRRYWPEVFLESNASYRNNDLGSFSDERQFQWEGALRFRFNLWDWGLRKRNVTIAEIQKTRRANVLDRGLIDLKATIQKLVLDINQIEKNYILTKELVELEKNNYETLERSYRNGRSSFLDLINSLNNYTNSQESFYRDLFRLKTLLFELQYHEGNLYENIQSS